jgi:hypothetical protein
MAMQVARVMVVCVADASAQEATTARGRAPWLLSGMRRPRPPWLRGRLERALQCWPLLAGRHRTLLKGLPFSRVS